MTALIEARRISRTYQRGDEDLHVLQDLSFEVAEGEFLALMGPSGSGKTTLLNLIGGLDQPDDGELVVGGQDITRMSKAELAAWRAQHVGFVFQTFNLIPVLTAVENVALPLLLTRLGRRERRERAQYALKLVGLEDRASHLPSQLSGGQEQRVAIARAIVSDPLFILADEPTGDLDRTSAGQVLTLLAELNKQQNKTIIMVTHDPHAAERASRLIHLEKGEVVDAPAAAAR